MFASCCCIKDSINSNKMLSLLQEVMQEGVLVSLRMMATHIPDYLKAVLGTSNLKSQAATDHTDCCRNCCMKACLSPVTQSESGKTLGYMHHAQGFSLEIVVAELDARRCACFSQDNIDQTLHVTAALLKQNNIPSCQRVSHLLQELMQEGVLVSPRMMADHMPDYLTAVLQRLAEKAGQGQPTSQRSGEFTIDIPPSPPVAKRGSRDYESRSLQHILRHSLATARAYAPSEESVELS